MKKIFKLKVISNTKTNVSLLPIFFLMKGQQRATTLANGLNKLVTICKFWNVYKQAGKVLRNCHLKCRRGCICKHFNELFIVQKGQLLLKKISDQTVVQSC